MPVGDPDRVTMKEDGMGLTEGVLEIDRVSVTDKVRDLVRVTTKEEGTGDTVLDPVNEANEYVYEELTVRVL